MPLLPREAAVSWTLPRWPQKICVDDVVAMASMYTATAGAASGVSSRSSSAAAADMRSGHDSETTSPSPRRRRRAAPQAGHRPRRWGRRRARPLVAVPWMDSLMAGDYGSL